ncbi:putative heat shock protein YegD [Candidatus Nitrotoga sp. HW29]|uniref:Hsp70 family protein n=1 Tax=Candidatus Nitrotoga sp. HW29 TaxID=2886963 RepID=UPI001EF2B091|nr:Hsp70 family protein [Candidatus Nitrotoga sp. HW29]CAH1905322.1 putative heat shock protein YegD [Candidatus Nitrotoga sp. HW29]
MSVETPARACGIDFGTSNSTVGWLHPNDSPLLVLENGKTTLPSVIFFNAEESTISIGQAGLNEYLEGYEGRLMRALKSLLGSNLMEGKTEIQGRSLPYKQLLTQFITELKCRAEIAADRSFDQAVFGRPVFFVDDDTAADQKAETTLETIAYSAGFREVSFQYEPIAAAYHYERQINHEELVLVADIGGGTSDFSLIRLSPQRALVTDRRDDLLANSGVHIGGTDFDRQLSLTGVMPLLGYGSLLKRGLIMPSSYYMNLATWHTINQVYTRRTWSELQELYLDTQAPEAMDRLLKLIHDRTGHWLAVQVEEAKIALSASDSAILHLDRLTPNLRHTLTRIEFEQASAELVERIGNTLNTLLAKASIRSESVDTIFFTGGASGVPILRERIAAILPMAKRMEGDLFGSVGAGLAVEAQRRFG